LLSDRVKLPTPQGGHPDDIAEVVASIVDSLPAGDHSVGVCFPAVVRAGRTMSAANVSDEWIGLDAQSLFERRLGRPIAILNDADAAGVAELSYGAAGGTAGVTIVTTLGTGIGSALLINGVLVPNTELGHLEIDGGDAEQAAAYSAKEREGLDWAEWAQRLQRYYSTLEMLFSPDLIVVGGGVSKHHESFLPLLSLTAPIVPATFRNNAGILGAASVGSHVVTSPPPLG
ncbi:polyphosphate--glucose phosphotransferase, partial [Mycetocola reblochoni]